MMRMIIQFSRVALGVALVADAALAQDSTGPYKVLDTTQLMGTGRH